MQKESAIGILKKIVFTFLWISLSLCFYGCSYELDPLENYKITAKNDITDYVERFNYDIKNWDNIYESLNECICTINSSNSREDVDAAVSVAKEKIDSAKYENNGDQDKTICFEQQIDNCNIIDCDIDENKIIRSFSELEEFIHKYHFFENYDTILSQYDDNFFNKKSLVFAFFWASDARVDRQIEKVSINENSLQIKIKSLFPDYLISEDGVIDINTDIFITYIILQVNTLDIETVKDIEIIF